MWEHKNNMVGTQKEKNYISTPPPPKKDEPSLMQILFPKVIRYHIFITFLAWTDDSSQDHGHLLI